MLAPLRKESTARELLLESIEGQEGRGRLRSAGDSRRRKVGVCQGERGMERTRKVTEERPEERRMSIREARGERKKSERLQRPSQVKRQISNKNLLAQEARKYSQKAKTTPEKKGCPEKVNRKIKETNEKTEEPKGEVTSSPREARRGERPPPLELPLSSSISSLCLSLTGPQPS